MADSGFDHEVALLKPLFQEASEANRDFKAHWKGQTERKDWEAFKSTEEYRKLLDRFWTCQRRLEEAILPALERLRAGQREGIDRALAYLSIPLRPFRSGYTSALIARGLRHAPLEERHRELLRRIILERITWPGASVRDLWKWIPCVKTPDFEHAVELLRDHESPWVARRATRLAEDYF
jgi:hypothetical protein